MKITTENRTIFIWNIILNKIDFLCPFSRTRRMLETFKNETHAHVAKDAKET